ncbi:ATP-dependent DNA helicase, RecQ family protein [Lactobacillus selangorensis]|uniref:ATP-dependent DNA helicase, RecQ family protein n=1 Tax=Lactobacillus selangorensis TaxID=81857 RepID=A0A0R2FZQ9_9LACO|nr:ATP-dependent DNA helicase RecQ [Lactobacillus selangorensis]KRN29440.1 ATP-dependent DNA helicase, RecQ family protein [Lactobacillus selangorensis]KRN34031.1 ATP-dependent DNA helicase, RecQ family protein [Lactobacillus selangorensis]
MPDLQVVLQHYFGYKAFKPGQEEVIQAVLKGQDTLAVLPTGSGKSLCYQLPAYLQPGLTVIVSPLLSLMQDQVMQLHYLGEKRVAALNSSLTPQERQQVLNSLGQYRFLFISPETLGQPMIIQRLSRLQIQCFVVDEAHCISQWGPDFRPDYLNLGRLRQQLQPHVTLALTATATKAVQQDILAKLRLSPATTKQIIYSIDRPNIYLATQEVADDAEKQQVLLAFVKHCQKPGIIYFSSRQRSEEIAALLHDKLQLRTAFYHGEVDTQDRFRIQQQFMQGQLDVICATNAFGMGINKANVRFVVHYHPPLSLEAYAQEIGRAGRDGRQSIALALYAPDDFYRQAGLLENGIPETSLIRAFYQQPSRFKRATGDEFELLRRYQAMGLTAEQVVDLLDARQQEKQAALTKVQHFMSGAFCKRAALVRFFGDPQAGDHNDRCCNYQAPDLQADLETLGLFETAPAAEPSDQLPLKEWQKVMQQLFFV